MTHRRSRTGLESTRDPSRRIRLPSTGVSQLGKSLRSAFEDEVSAPIPQEFKDLLESLS